MKIAYTKPSITQLEIDFAADAAANGCGSKCYDYIIRFENEFAAHINSKHSIATSSCTGALTMGLHALGIGPGDEVILADTNWIATVSPIVHLGATPVFVDILEDTWCINPKEALKAITSKTKAIIATHLYGNLCEMDELLEIGKSYNIDIIEDAAEAIGSTYFGKKAGSMGKFSTFSFHGTKTITTGEGGIFLTNSSELYERVLTLSNHGRERTQSKQFWADECGFKFKMSNIQAAIGCAQLLRIEELCERKKDILKFYKNAFVDKKYLKMNLSTTDKENGAWMPTLVFHKDSGISREILLETFSKNDIDARVFFWPLSSLPMFKPNYNNFIAYDIPNRAINLPSYHDITDNDLNKVVECVEGVFS